jgi:hypothetical protein
MAAALKVEVDGLIKQLTFIEKTQIPFACKLTVRRLAKAVAKKDIPAHMKQVFQAPNSLTLRSLNYKVISNHEARLDFIEDVKKGNSPTNYLAPVTKPPLGPSSTKAYETKFSRFVKKAGIVPRNFYPIPVKENLSKNSLGKVSQGEYSKAWSGLNAASSKGSRKDRYFSIPDNRMRGIGKKQLSLFGLPNGIYRVKGKNNVQLLFTYATKSAPQVPKIFDPYGVAQEKVAKRAPGIFRDALRQALK